MCCLFPPLVRRWSVARQVAIAAVALACIAGTATAAPPAALVGSGVATVPHDAAFFRSSLRLKEQFDLFVASNAYQALRDLPAVDRALDSWEEQREQPGSMGSMILAFLELPENAQAAELLSDMVATDTFVYGEPSCTSFLRLLLKVQRAQQAATLMEGQGDDPVERSDAEMEEEAAAPARPAIVPVRRQIGLEVSPVGSQAAAVLETLAQNLDLLVVPDVVWGFKTTKREAGEFQLKRLEVLSGMLVDMNPDLAGSLARKKVEGGEVVTFTLDGDLLPWDEIADGLVDELGESDDLERVLDRVRKLDVVLAIGVIGDWVVISVGDSIDHLDKLVIGKGAGRSLIDTPPFEPLVADADRKLTAIAYLSEALAEAIAPSADDFDAYIAAAGMAVEANDLPRDAGRETTALLERAAAEYGKRLPEPGAWMAYSFLAKEGFEGYDFDFSSRQPFDGGSRLDLLAHAGGDPLGAVAFRLKPDKALIDTLTSLASDGWKLLAKYGRPKMRGEEGERFDEFDERIAPLGGKLATIIRDKVVAALGDGEIGLVLDAKTTTTKPQADLPSSAEPLPLLEPAIVLPLSNRKLFIEGLDDLFALGDELVAEIRRFEPGAIPDDYEIPAPTKEKVEAGVVWAFPLDEAGVDPQVQPAIGVGEDAAVLALVPKHASRLLATTPIETAATISRFAEPLAAAAALDFAGVIDALEPWVVYLTRYGCVQQAAGEVDPEARLTEEDETVEAAEALDQIRVVLDVARCLKEAAAETTLRDGARVTHWRNVIRDLPAP